MFKKILFILLLILSTVGGCYAGRVSSSLDLMNRSTDKSLSKVDLGNAKVTSDNEIVNILLVGSDSRDELGSEKYGRSDTMMIATLDNKHKCLKLTSMMRDMNVEIPGYGRHKFNASFSYGGVELLYKTIATNFGVSLDGYVVVDFNAFVDIIDEIGGVDIKLTQEEAHYLNHTNYIKGKKNRHLRKGWNTMNGAQALGYCRVRKVANVNGTNNDQGRTERQRMVMNAILSKVKTMSMSKWMDILEAVLPNIFTDVSNSDIISYATSVALMGTTEIKQCQVPIDGYYQNGTSVTDGDVLEIDLDANRRLLQEFLFEYDGKGKSEALAGSEGDE